MPSLSYSTFLGDIEDTNDAVSAADREHLTAVAKVCREARSGEVVDAVAGLEEAITVEDLDFVGAGAARNDQVVRVLLELCCVELHWGR